MGRLRTTIPTVVGAAAYTSAHSPYAAWSCSLLSRPGKALPHTQGVMSVVYAPRLVIVPTPENTTREDYYKMLINSRAGKSRAHA